MGNADRAALLPLAESIADGSPIDWNAVELRAPAEDQPVIRQLRVLAELATLHRTMPASPGTPPTTVAARRTDMAPAIGTWAHLDLIERVGGGTFGTVYRAWDRHLEREVALKLLRVDEAVDNLQASRIAREGRLLARVRHPNVVTVHGVAVHDGRVGLWMELIDGATLEQTVVQNGPFGAREAALIGIDLCRALAAIHAAGLIHRDVKAQNVMREQGGRIVLMDLGTGREIAPDRVEPLPDLAGTPLYLAPEIFTGEPASERTDLFSLGILLYHLVTGSFPVRAATFDGLREAHRQGVRTHLRDARADLPTAFVRVIDRATATNPAERYVSAGSLEADLAQALDGAAPSVLSPQDAMSPDSRGWWTQRVPRRLGVGLVIAAILTVVGLSLSRLLSGTRPIDPRPDGKVALAVLPLEDLTGGQQTSRWPDLIQALFVEALAGVNDIAIMEPLSMNAMIANKLGTAAPKRNPELFNLMRRARISFVIDGTIMTAGGGGYDVRINLVDPSSGEARFPARVTVENEQALTTGVQSLAQGILGFLQLQRSQLANDKDLRPWITRGHNIQAVNAFLQASQHIFRDERVAAEKYLQRAIDLDPTIIQPRVWLIPALMEKQPEEAQAQYQALLKLEADASPFEQAMIAFAGAVLNNDIATQIRQLEIALEYLPGNNILLVNLAELREERGDCGGALEAMRPAIDMRWRYPPMYELWGWCSIHAAHFDEARQVLLDAVKMPPVHPHVYALLSGLAIADGNVTAAAQHDAAYTARVRELDQPARTRYAAKAFAHLGSHCVSLGQFDRAARLFSKAIDAFQKTGDSHQADRIRRQLNELEAARR